MPSSVAIVTNAVTRVFNTWVQISDQRPCRVNYNIIITTSASLVAGQTGRVILDTADDALGTNMVSLQSGESGFAAGLLLPGSSGSVTVIGVIGVAKYMRLRPVAVTGAATYQSFNPNTGTYTANSGFGTETLYD